MDLDLDILMNIEMGQEYSYVEIDEGKKKLPKKRVNTRDFIRSLLSVAENIDYPEIPLLPGNYGTKKIQQAGDSDYYILYTTPPGVRKLEYSNITMSHVMYLDNSGNTSRPYDDESVEEMLTNDCDMFVEEDQTLEVYCPSTVWFIHAREKSDGDDFRVIDTRMYSSVTELYSMDMEISHSPFDNVYPNDTVCWGDAELPETKIAGLSSLNRIFFSNIFNLDLTNTHSFKTDVGGRTFISKYMFLFENDRILSRYGEEDAREHMVEGLQDRTLSVNLGSLWDRFTNNNLG